MNEWESLNYTEKGVKLTTRTETRHDLVLPARPCMLARAHVAIAFRCLQTTCHSNLPLSPTDNRPEPNAGPSLTLKDPYVEIYASCLWS